MGLTPLRCRQNYIHHTSHNVPEPTHCGLVEMNETSINMTIVTVRQMIFILSYQTSISCVSLTIHYLASFIVAVLTGIISAYCYSLWVESAASHRGFCKRVLNVLLSRKRVPPLTLLYLLTCSGDDDNFKTIISLMLISHVFFFTLKKITKNFLTDVCCSIDLCCVCVRLDGLSLSPIFYKRLLRRALCFRFITISNNCLFKPIPRNPFWNTCGFRQAGKFHSTFLLIIKTLCSSHVGICGVRACQLSI